MDSKASDPHGMASFLPLGPSGLQLAPSLDEMSAPSMPAESFDTEDREYDTLGAEIDAPSFANMTGWLKVKVGVESSKWWDVYAICSNSNLICLRHPGDTEPLIAIPLGSEWAAKKEGNIHEMAVKYRISVDEDDFLAGEDPEDVFFTFKVFRPTSLEAAEKALGICSADAPKTRKGRKSKSKQSGGKRSRFSVPSPATAMEYDNTEARTFLKQSGELGCVLFASQSVRSVDHWVSVINSVCGTSQSLDIGPSDNGTVSTDSTKDVGAQPDDLLLSPPSMAVGGETVHSANSSLVVTPENGSPARKFVDGFNSDTHKAAVGAQDGQLYQSASSAPRKDLMPGLLPRLLVPALEAGPLTTVRSPSSAIGSESNGMRSRRGSRTVPVVYYESDERNLASGSSSIQLSPANSSGEEGRSGDPRIAVVLSALSYVLRWLLIPWQEWRPLFFRNGLRTYLPPFSKHFLQEMGCVKAMAVVESATEEVFRSLRDVSSYHQWNSVIKEVQVVERIDRHTDVVYFAVRPCSIWFFPVAARDFCVLRRWNKEGDGSYVISMTSCSHKACPPLSGYIRGRLKVQGYHIKGRNRDHYSSLLPPSCLVTCFMQLEPGGWLAHFLFVVHLYTSELLGHLVGLQDHYKLRQYLSPTQSEELQKEAALVTQRLSIIKESGQLHGEDFGTDGLELLPPEPDALGSAGRRQDLLRHEGVAAASGAVKPDVEQLHREELILRSVQDSFPSAVNGDGTQFKVRGPGYLEDKVKIPSKPALLSLVATDLFEVLEKTDHIASKPQNRVQLAIEEAKRRGVPCPFTLVMQFQIPGSPQMALVLYFQAKESNAFDPGTPWGTLWQNFLNGSDSYRDSRLKIIPNVTEGNWIVKSSVGSTPAILGNKLTQRYFKGEHYFEIDCDVGSSSVAQGVLKVVKGYLTMLVLDLAFVLEGKAKAELPERILAVVRLQRCDLGHCKKWPTAA